VAGGVVEDLPSETSASRSTSMPTGVIGNLQEGSETIVSHTTSTPVTTGIVEDLPMTESETPSPITATTQSASSPTPTNLGQAETGSGSSSKSHTPTSTHHSPTSSTALTLVSATTSRPVIPVETSTVSTQTQDSSTQPFVGGGTLTSNETPSTQAQAHIGSRPAS
jgi:hypothetical protein